MGGASYFAELMSEDYEIEQMETFEKQTFRNRCLIRDPKGTLVRLSVPVGKVEHKQLTRDIRISYQANWQHQHWIAIESAYRHKPYFLYFADYLRPHYERQYTWLLDLNDALTETIVALLHRERPTMVVGTETAMLREVRRTQDWNGQTWTDCHPWQTEISILDKLFDD